MNSKNLTVLSFGGGQDSTAILYKMIYNTQFRQQYAPGELIVIMADTHNEHEETYKHVEGVKQLCQNHGILFKLIAGSEGFTSKSWSKGLIGFYEDHNAVGSKCFPKTCTDKLKIVPIYNYLEQYIHTMYGTEKVGRKRAIKEFTENNGRLNVLIGIAKGEEKRMSTNEESPSVWMRQCINKVYPLIDIGYDRQACQDYIEEVGHTVPLPSNCILCPFMSLQELLYLHLQMPEWYHKWVQLEANKINANTHVENNMGVWGKKLLPEKLKEAQDKYGHMTIGDLREYKMSHGHCVKSKY